MSTPNPSRPLVLGGILAVASIAALVVSISAVNGLPWDRGELYSAHVENANHLLAGAQVQVTGVHVGNVESVEVHPDGGARVWFRVRELPDGALRQDARAAVRPRSPLGQQLFVLRPGSPESPPLAAGSEIPRHQTGFPSELDEILDVFDGETVSDTRDVIRAAGGGLLGTGPELEVFVAGAPELLETLDETVEIVAAREESVARLLRSGASLTERLDSRGDTIASLFDDGGTTMRALGAGDALERTLALAPEGLDEGSAALRRLAAVLDPTDQALEDIGPGVESLAASMPEARQLLRDGVSTFDELADVAEDADEPIAALEPAVADLVPFLSQLEDMVTAAVPAVEYLAPYGPEIGKWFRLGSSVIGHGDGRSNWLRFLVQMSDESLANGTANESPLVNSHPYPEPGEAPKMRERYEPAPGVTSTEEQD